MLSFSNGIAARELAHCQTGLVFGEGERGYSDWSRSKQALDKSAELGEEWTLHDLRRAAATRMADLDVQLHVIEAIRKSGVAGIDIRTGTRSN